MTVDFISYVKVCLEAVGRVYTWKYLYFPVCSYVYSRVFGIACLSVCEESVEKLTGFL